MPFELGIALGLEQCAKQSNGPLHEWFMIYDGKFEHKDFLSDLAGLDPGRHTSTPATVIDKVAEVLRGLEHAEATRTSPWEILDQLEFFEKECECQLPPAPGKLRWAELSLAAKTTIAKLRSARRESRRRRTEAKGAAPKTSIDPTAILPALVQEPASVPGHTESVKGEAAAPLVNEIALQLFEALPFPASLKRMDRERRIVWCNAAYEHAVRTKRHNIIGRTLGEILGTTVDEPPDYGRGWARSASYKIAGKQVFFIERRIAIADEETDSEYEGDLSIVESDLVQARSEVVPYPRSFFSADDPSLQGLVVPPNRVFATFFERLTTVALLKNKQRAVIWCNQAFVDLVSEFAGAARTRDDILGKTSLTIFGSSLSEQITPYEDRVIDQQVPVLGGETISKHGFFQQRFGVRYPIFNKQMGLEYIAVVSADQA